MWPTLKCENCWKLNCFLALAELYYYINQRASLTATVSKFLYFRPQGIRTIIKYKK
jgi:hypothetical protein